jgi:hypothetical protein
MKQEKAIYRSYLLRFWHVKQNGGWTWRASLEEVATGKRQAFANLDVLFSFLQNETAESLKAQEEPENEKG